MFCFPFSGILLTFHHFHLLHASLCRLKAAKDSTKRALLQTQMPCAPLWPIHINYIKCHK